jgi:AraC-like DNA-binding protein
MQKTKLDYFNKYHTVSSNDTAWGLYITDAGYTRIHPHTKYPGTGHPMDYMFNWDKGRILQEYQLIYISEGSGIFESSTAGKKKISAGSFILLFPGEWHRYQPLKKTGWIEHWVGFKGNIAEHLFQHIFFNTDSPIYFAGYSDRIIEIYAQINSLSEKEPPAFQQMISGLVLQLLGITQSVKNINLFEGKPIEEKIQQARRIMRESIQNNITIEDIASQLNIGYSLFRRMFKKYTGMAPLQYHLQLRLLRAKELLLIKSMTVKEIAFELNFDTPFYFSRLFKEKTGFSPQGFRKKAFDIRVATEWKKPIQKNL